MAKMSVFIILFPLQSESVNRSRDEKSRAEKVQLFLTSFDIPTKEAEVQFFLPCFNIFTPLRRSTESGDRYSS